MAFGDEKMILSPNRVEIDLSALTHNLNEVKRLVGTKTKIMGIVKSDAYGHGAATVSRVLEKQGVHSLGVAHLYEALELREKGMGCPIVVLCGIKTEEEAKAAIDKNLTPVLFDMNQVEFIADECAKTGKRAGIYLKVDTGMGRLGILLSDLKSFLGKIMTYEEIFVEGLTSHLSSADEPSSAFTRLQVERFSKAIDIARSMGLSVPLNNLANSAGIMGYREAHFDMVRPGIMLYGGYPCPEFQSLATLRPVMHFKGQVIQVKNLPDASPVSYGRTYHTTGQQTIAVISAGYGDGLPRSLSSVGKVLIGGKKVPILGRVCMNMIMADVSGSRGIRAGDEAVFLGLQGEEMIAGDDMASWAGTIAYEVFCSLGQRNKKEYRQ